MEIFFVTGSPFSASSAWSTPCLPISAGLLGDQGLDDAVLEVLDLLRAGVEADDLDLAELAGLRRAGGGALGAEQVGGEDARRGRGAWRAWR